MKLGIPFLLGGRACWGKKVVEEADNERFYSAYFEAKRGDYHPSGPYAKLADGKQTVDKRIRVKSVHGIARQRQCGVALYSLVLPYVIENTQKCPHVTKVSMDYGWVES